MKLENAYDGVFLVDFTTEDAHLFSFGDILL